MVQKYNIEFQDGRTAVSTQTWGTNIKHFRVISNPSVTFVTVTKTLLTALSKQAYHTPVMFVS